jgi:hypothetical protein
MKVLKERRGQVVNILFRIRESQVQISARKLAILTEVFRRFPESIHESVGLLT